MDNRQPQTSQSDAPTAGNSVTGTAATPPGSAKPRVPPLTPAALRMLAVSLSGSFLVSLSAQFPSTNIADLQGAFGSTPDEASWISTVYTMASFAGIVVSGPMIKAIGMGRYMVANSLIVAVTALVCSHVMPLPWILALRTLQGFAAGGFGPVAFIAVFMVCGGARLPHGLTVLAFVLLFPVTLGPIVSALVEEYFGWSGLFQLQAIFGALLAFASSKWLPLNPGDRTALRTDWLAIAVLILGLSMLMLVLSQGTRRFWFESGMIVSCTAISAGAWAAFVFLCRVSPAPIITPGTLLLRKFSVPIILNLVFRAGFVVTSYLVPQFLGLAQGYRPIQIAGLLSWAALPQAAALPLVWFLLHKLDSRWIMGLGLVFCGAGTALVTDTTAQFAANQFQWAIAAFAIGQMFFLVPNLVVGASSLRPSDLPTASLAFNMTTLGGTTLGVAIVSNLVTEREKFHSNVLVENVSVFQSIDADRLSAIATALGGRLIDDDAAMRAAVSNVAAVVRREAWVLSYNDGFLLVAAVLALSALGVIWMGRCAPIERHFLNGSLQS